MTSVQVSKARFVEGPLKCPKCPKFFSRPDSVLHHLYAVHGVEKSRGCREVHRCPVKGCEKAYKLSGRLRRHLFESHKVNPCDVIPGARPMLVKGGDPLQKIRCRFGFCTKAYRSKDALYHHIRTVHKAVPREVMGEIFDKRPPRPNGDVATIPCLISGCEKEFTQVSSFMRHVRSVHRLDPEPFRDEAKARMEGRWKEIRRIGNGKNRDGEESKGRGHSKTEGQKGNGPLQTEEFQEFLEELLDGEELMEEDFPLCFLCCYPFNLGYEEMFEKLSESFHFYKFVCEMLPAEELPKNLEELEVCLECRNLVTSSMERKLGVEEVTMRIRRRFESEEMKSLHLERLTDYWGELMKMGEVITGAEVGCLKKRKLRSLAKKLRRGILRETKELQRTIMELEDAVSK